MRVAGAGSFTAAARVLGVPTSTLTRRVRRLEDELELTVFNRSGRGVRLTGAGELLRSKVAAPFHSLDQVRRSLHDDEAFPRGVLRITAPSDLGATAAFAQVLAGFHRLCPEVQLDVLLSQRTFDLVAEDVDVAVRPSVGTPPEAPGLMARRLGTVSGGLFASPDYLLARGVPTSAQALAEHDLLVHSALARESALRGGLKGLGEKPAIQVNDFGALRLLALGGHGIAFLPTFVSGPDQASGELVRVLSHVPDLTDFQGSLWAIWPEARHLSPKLRAFLDYLFGLDDPF